MILAAVVKQRTLPLDLCCLIWRSGLGVEWTHVGAALRGGRSSWSPAGCPREDKS